MRIAISELSSAAAALLVGFWGASALAGTGGRLEYRAPEGCASAVEFEASVAERGGHFDGGDAPNAARQLRVSIAQVPGGFQGSFQTVDQAGSSALREVHGASCQEVVAALAVVSAIALRGDDESKIEDSKSEPSPPGSPAPAASLPPRAPAAPAREPEPALARDDGRLHASSIVGPEKIEVGAGTLRFDVARSVTLFAGGELGLLPGVVLPRYDLSLSAANFVTTPEGKSYIVGVIPRFRLSYIGSGTYHASDVAVSGRAVVAGLGLCWSPTFDTRAWAVLLCTEYGVGAMQLKSRDTRGNLMLTQSPALQTVGLGLETEYHLGSLLHLGLKLGGDLPIQPLTAVRPNGSRIFQSSTFAGYGMLGLGFHL